MAHPCTPQHVKQNSRFRRTNWKATHTASETPLLSLCSTNSINHSEQNLWPPCLCYFASRTLNYKPIRASVQTANRPLQTLIFDLISITSTRQSEENSNASFEHAPAHLQDVKQNCRICRCNRNATNTVSERTP